jgi:hypothetical protein
MPLPRINHPITTIKLPASGREIKVRPFLVKDEKILLHAKATNNRADMLQAIKQIVNNCIVTEDFDIDQLPLVDLEYLFIRLRAQSVNNICVVSYLDGEDQKSYDFEIDLNKIEVKFFEDCNKVIPVNSNIELHMKFPPAALYDDTVFTSEDQEMEYFITKTLDKVVQGEQVWPINLENEAETLAFIHDLPAKTYEGIRAFWAKMPTIYHEIKYTNSLGNERKVVLSTLDDFFLF